MIGIFDSGIGGFSVLNELRKIAPGADVVYFGDTINAPYGNKSRDEVTKLTYQGIKLLIENGATEIISACNSVSVSIVLPMFNLWSLSADKVIEMVGPVIKDFSTDQHSEKILLVATEVTINSGLYQNAFALIDRQIDTLSIKSLAGLIESGADHKLIEEVIHQSLDQIIDQGYDTILLGCTHYPLVIALFENVLNRLGVPNTNLYDPAIAVAQKACQKFDVKGAGKTKFIFSKDTAQSRQYRKNFI